MQMDDDTKSTVSYMDAITELLYTMQDINEITKKVNDELKALQELNSSHTDKAQSAKQALKTANDTLDSVVQDLLTDLQDKLEAEPKESYASKKSYQAVEIDGAFLKKEAKYSYLIEFPRQVTNSKETCVWIPKTFSTLKGKDRGHLHVDIRFYPNTKFYFFQSNDPDAKKEISAEDFPGYCLAANTFLKIFKPANEPIIEKKDVGGETPPKPISDNPADFFNENKETGDENMVGYSYEETVAALNRQTKKNVQSAEAWEKYLDAQAHFASLRYSDVALIMEQKPNSTEVHSYRSWNKYGYYVRKGQKGINFLNHQDLDKHYLDNGFDITQVSPKRYGYVHNITRWEIKEDYRNDVYDYLKDAYQISPDAADLKAALTELAQSAGMAEALDTDKDRRLLKKTIGDDQAHQLIADSAEYILLKRCGYQPDFSDRFADISLLENADTVSLATAVGDAARNAVIGVIREISREIPSIERNAIEQHKQQETKKERIDFNDASYGLAKRIFDFEKQYDTDFDKRNTAFDEIFGYIRTGKVAGLKMHFADILAKDQKPVSDKAADLITQIDTFIDNYSNDLIKVVDGVNDYEKPALEMPVIRKRELDHFLKQNIWGKDSVYHNAKLVISWAMNAYEASDEDKQTILKAAYMGAADKQYQLSNGSSIADAVDTGIAVYSKADPADVTLFTWPEIQNAVKEQIDNDTYLTAEEKKAYAADMERVYDEDVGIDDVLRDNVTNIFAWFNMHGANETIVIPSADTSSENTRNTGGVEKISLFDDLEDLPTEASMKESENEEPESNPELTITDDDLANLLKAGTEFEGGKYIIQALYTTESDKNARIDTLKAEYGIGGRTWKLLNGSDCFAHYDSKGVTFSNFEANIEKTYSWQKADETLVSLIKANEYLDDQEKKIFEMPEVLPFDQQVDMALANHYDQYSDLLISRETPQILRNAGCDNLPIFYTKRHLKNAVKASSTGDQGHGVHYHNMPAEIIKSAPVLMAEPAMIFDSLSSNNTLVEVTDTVCNNMPVIIAVRPNGSGKVNGIEYPANFAVSIYPRENIMAQLEKAVELNKVLYVNKEKSQRLASVLGLPLPQCLTNLTSDIILHQSQNISNHELADDYRNDLRDFLINYTYRIMPDGADQFAIYDLYIEGERTEDERIQVISHQYQIESPETDNTIPFSDIDPIVDDLFVQTTTDGIVFRNKKGEVTAYYSWQTADEMIGHLVLHGYLDDDELKYYKNEYHKEAEEAQSLPQQVSETDVFGDEQENSEEKSGGETPPEAEASVSVPNTNPINYHPESAEADFSFSPKQKFNDNIAAIRTLKEIEKAGRFATAEEQKILAKYIGWGGLANAFDPTKQDWQQEYQQLKEILTPAEYSSAAGSTTTAFYTNPIITHAIIEKMEAMGFTHGNLLEPGCGTGNFLGAIPEDLEDKIKAYGVEMDSISGRIAKQLYQKAQIYVERLQDSNLQDNMFDAAVGNVPFEEVRIRDSKYGNQHFLLHDYMIARSIDMLRPNGIAALITSSGTMDKKNEDFRLWLSRKADLIGAVRLPSSAFMSAGTTVTTDILFFQKRETPAVTVPEWVHVVPAADLVLPREMLEKEHELKKVENEAKRDYEALCSGWVNYDTRREKWDDWNRARDEWLKVSDQIDKYKSDHSGLSINQYFMSHKDMIIGNVDIGTNQFGKEVLVFKDKEDTALMTAVADAFKHFNAQITYTAQDQRDDKEEAADILPASADVPDDAFTVINGRIYQRHESQMLPVTGLSKMDESRLSGLINLRNAMDDVLDANRNHDDDQYLQEKQSVLNNAYDSFTEEYGFINSNANKKAFSSDPSYYRLCSLEILNNKQEVVGKADIFTKRTIRYAKIITSADNAADALNASIAEKGNVDFAYMQQLTGKTEDELKDDLQGQIFLDPDDNEYKPADEYLYGNVRRKLKTAETLVEEGHNEYKVNVEYLKDAQPEDIPASDIAIPLGATWVPEKYINQFMYDTFNTPRWHQVEDEFDTSGIYATYSAAGGAGAWNITGKALDGGNPRVTSTYGTEYTHANAYWLMEDCLNLRQRVIKEKDSLGNTVINQEATAEAQAKQDAIKEQWTEWVFKDPERREDLTQIYNNRFNHDRLREFDGSHIQFKGMNPEIELRPHQKDAVAHIIRGGNTLLAHTVGAGKTYEMIAAAMELKRLGKCTKSMIVVPKHLTEQWGHDFMKLYPGANILVATEKDFTPERRKKFCTQIATGNYDAVILGYTQFMRIPLSIERQEADLQNQIDEINEELRSYTNEEKRKWGVKQQQKFKHALEEKLKELSETPKDDNVIDFESLGIDHLFVDEAHNFKNLYVITKLNRVAGISTSASQQAYDMYSKCRYLDEITNYQGVTFATGTPVSNSMTELFTMMRYLQADRLKEMHMSLFDEWATTFGEITHEAELSPEGSSFRMKDRMAHFINVPELMTVFREAADIQTGDMLNLDVPEAEFIKVDVPISSAQKEYINELGERADQVKARQVDVTEDNMLKITTDGRKAALDMRCIDPAFPEAQPSKVSICADEIYRMYESSNDIKGTQMVFCDQSTPSKKDADKYSIYTDLKVKLIAKGIPAEQIAFIHEANSAKEKDALFAKVRSGEIRVLIGSTAKMGTGTNAQDRMVALHHLDVPWRPADLEQREGRIIRQGNMNKTVKIFRYITKDTFDAYSWQLIEQKQRFASQIMTSKNPARTVDDVDEAVMSYAEVKAACIGNPEIKEQIDLKYEVTKLKAAKKAFMNNVYTLQDKIRKQFPQQIKVLEKQISNIDKDADTALKILGWKPEDFSVEIDGKTYTTNKEAGKALMETAQKKAWQQKDQRVTIGRIGGFDIQTEYSTATNLLSVIVHGNIGHSFQLGSDAVGNMARLRFAIKGITEKKQAYAAALVQVKDQLATAKKDVENAIFPKEDELKQKAERLAELNAKYSAKGGTSLNGDKSVENPVITQRTSIFNADDETKNHSGGITM